MTMTKDQLAEAIAANKPRPYDLDKPDELLRLYRECHGYLHTCHHMHGTDWEGRKFAMEALDGLMKKTNVLRHIGATQRRLMGS